MKDAKQFFTDYTENKELRGKIFEELNRLRTDDTLKLWQAGQKAALALGYEIPDDVAKMAVARELDDDSEELSDDEAAMTAGGQFGSTKCKFSC